jgi:chorismate mutase
VAVRAVRGATQVAADDREVVLAATRELVGAVLQVNGLDPDDVLSILFTATGDLRSVAPAMAARQLGLHDTALLCAQEMAVPGSMPRVVRLMAHIDSERPRDRVRNVYLNGTETLVSEVPPVIGQGAP